MTDGLRVVALTLRTVHPEVMTTVDGVRLPASLYADGATEPNVRLGPFVARAFIAAGDGEPPCLVLLIPVPNVEMGRVLLSIAMSEHLGLAAIAEGEDWTEAP